MTDLIKSAEIFARSRHAGQFRKGDAQEPYIVHVEEVAELVTAWGGSESAIAAAWLHDTVEDCPPTSFAEIEQEFGSEVAGIVREMTDDKSLPKAERKKMQILNAAKKSEAACSAYSYLVQNFLNHYFLQDSTKCPIDFNSICRPRNKLKLAFFYLPARDIFSEIITI